MKKILFKILLIFSLFLGLVGCEAITDFFNNDILSPIVEDQEDNEDKEEDEDQHDLIDEFGFFTSRDEVALYIYTYGRLPQNYITKSEAGSHISNHWTPHNKKSIGGDRFYNREGLLPDKPGRIYFEADINYQGQKGRNAERIVFSNDGLIFYTDNHYESFVKYDPEDGKWKSY